MTEELKPCPFCGGEARLVHCMNAPCRVVCEECGCGTRWFACDDREHAIEEWNRRAARTCHVKLNWCDHEDGCSYDCSECGESFGILYGELNFCPNCGAKVVVE